MALNMVSDLDIRLTEGTDKVNTIGKSVETTNKDMKDVSERVQKNDDAIKLLQSMKDGYSSDSSMLAKCIKEVEERARRSKNLMIFGLLFWFGGR